MDACYQRCKEAEEAADDFTRHQSTALLILFYKTLKTKTKKKNPTIDQEPRVQNPTCTQPRLDIFLTHMYKIIKIKKRK